MITLRAASWTYPGGRVVGPVDLDVAPGERVLLTGPTGCGKSTLLRLAAGILQRHGAGRADGCIRLDGDDPADLVAARRVTTLGVVAQDPDDQIVAGTCAGEIAFGLGSAGWSAPERDRRVAEVLAEVGLDGLADADPRRLSGGQRQRLVIGAAVAARARVLLLDEPLAQLDPRGAAEVLGIVDRLAASGVAVLLVEHRLELAWDHADRVVLLADGRVVADPLRDPAALARHGLRGPAYPEIVRLLGPPPWRRRAGTPADAPPPGPVRVELERVYAGYVAGEPVLHDVSLRVHAGERVAVIGENGAGKSTLLQAIAGHLGLRGHRRVEGRVVDVPQDPDLALFCESVREELAYGPVEAGRADVAEGVRAAADALSVTDLLDRPPQALSRGQRLRVAVAAAVACSPTVLLLDEPTSGQDRDQVDRMFAGLRLSLGEAALVFACHDLDVVLRHATRVVRLGGGRVRADGPPLPTVLESGLPVPPLARMCAELDVPYGAPEDLARHLERVG